MNIDNELQDLETAEEFLDHFAIDYDPAVVHVNRLHILQRFHDYNNAGLPEGEVPRREVLAANLGRAYADFVSSDAQTEKVFKVFQATAGHTAYVSVDQLRRT